jgi:two-component sensor histidine kinase
VGIYGEDSTRVLVQSKDLPLKNIRSIEKGKNQQIWLGTSSGVYVTDGTFYEPWVYNDFLEDKVVYSIKNYKDSIWFIGTANGLYYSNGMSVVKMNLHPSFGANYINFIGLEKDRFLWVGTNYGIFEIDLRSYLKDQNKGLLHHTENSGLTSIETNLNAVFIDAKDQVWMGTGDGLIRFDRRKRKQTSLDILPKVELKEVQLFLRETNWSDYNKEVNAYTQLPTNLVLTSRNNYLTFYFEGLSLTHPDELTYKIILEGLDQEWTPNIMQTSFTYPNLSYGDYTFKVKASIDGVHWSDPVSFSFTINKPYYLTWWFISICVTLGLLLIYIVYRWRSNVIEQKDRTEKLVYKSRLLALEQQTLNASMNRHFIFNALNSIQYYINSQDRLSANRYLTSFAKLIRKNLDSSVSSTGLVTLADELDRLKLYVSLEHMRFQEKFEFEIDVNPDVDVEAVMIPPMILQPFVENSIWHGLLPKEEGGKLWVKIYRGVKGVVFEIEDNGIGYEESMSRKTENSHQSKGMLITSGRLEILKKVNQQNMTINGPFQVYGEDGKVCGTKVILMLENKIL